MAQTGCIEGALLARPEAIHLSMRRESIPEQINSDRKIGNDSLKEREIEREQPTEREIWTKQADRIQQKETYSHKETE